MLLQLLAQVSDEPRRSQVRAGLDRACSALDLEDVAGSFAAAHPLLKELLARPAAASAHRMSAVGHAHIDTAWLWPLRETRPQVRPHLLDRRAPDGRVSRLPVRLLAGPAVRVDEGPATRISIGACRRRWRAGSSSPSASMWVEADCNIPSGESLVRQFLHGKRFFARRARRRDTTRCGCPTSSATRPTFRRSCARPASTASSPRSCPGTSSTCPPTTASCGKGSTASQVFTHFPPADTYNGDASVAELVHAVRNFKDHDRATRSLYVYGYGDGGGGPTAGMLEQLRRLADLEGVPRVELEAASRLLRQGRGRPRRPAGVGRRAVPRAPPRHLHDPGRHQEGQPRRRAGAARGRAVGQPRSPAVVGLPGRSSWSRPGRRCSSTSSTTSSPARESTRSTRTRPATTPTWPPRPAP